MNIVELLKERAILEEKIKEIDRKIGTPIEVVKLEELRQKVKEFTGIDVHQIGKGSHSKVSAKRLFWHMGFLNNYKGECLSNFTGDKTRFTALAGRRTHIKLCKTDKSVENEWNRFKNFVKNG